MGSGGGSRTERHPGPAVQIAGVAGPRRIDGPPASPAGRPRPHPPGKGRRTTEYEAASLAISRAGLTASYIGLAIAAGNMLAAIVAAVGIWVFGLAMKHSNDQRAEAEKRRAEVEKDRHEESMTALKELIRRTSPPRPGPAE